VEIFKLGVSTLTEKHSNLAFIIIVERAYVKAEDRTRYFVVVAIVSHVSEI
jgi:hypothetical protein